MNIVYGVDTPDCFQQTVIGINTCFALIMYAFLIHNYCKF